MNTAQDILTYAESHEIQMSARDGKLVLEGRLTDEFLESAKKHKPDLLLFTIVSDACTGLDLSPDQFIRILNSKGKQQIISGELSASTLKDHAKQIDNSINDGVVNLIMERINTTCDVVNT